MGLKGLKLPNRKLPNLFDKIRPKWDWKIAHFWIRKNEDIDKIRPKWDWKLVSLVIAFVTVPSIKSDQNGIESRHIGNSFLCLFYALIKSDQNGIERLINCHLLIILITIKSDQNGIESFPESSAYKFAELW